MSETMDLVVIGKGQYSLKVEGQEKYFNLSKKLQEQGVTLAGFANFPMRIRAEVWTSPQGAKYINKYEQLAQPITAPSGIPASSVTSTPPSNGPAPVQPARPIQQSASADEDRMTKADWAKKDVVINCAAIWKSVIQSPAFTNVYIGKSPEEVTRSLAAQAASAADAFFTYVEKKVQ